MLLYTIHRSLIGFSSYRTFGYCSMSSEQEKGYQPILESNMLPTMLKY